MEGSGACDRVGGKTSESATFGVPRGRMRDESAGSACKPSIWDMLPDRRCIGLC